MTKGMMDSTALRYQGMFESERKECERLAGKLVALRIVVQEAIELQVTPVGVMTAAGVEWLQDALTESEK